MGNPFRRKPVPPPPVQLPPASEARQALLEAQERAEQVRAEQARRAERRRRTIDPVVKDIINNLRAKGAEAK